jgi:hypothetical protein
MKHMLALAAAACSAVVADVAAPASCVHQHVPGVHKVTIEVGPDNKRCIIGENTLFAILFVVSPQKVDLAVASQLDVARAARVAYYKARFGSNA